MTERKLYREKDTGQFASAQDEAERPDEITEETLTTARRDIHTLLDVYLGTKKPDVEQIKAIAEAWEYEG